MNIKLLVFEFDYISSSLWSATITKAVVKEFDNSRLVSNGIVDNIVTLVVLKSNPSELNLFNTFSLILHQHTNSLIFLLFKYLL